MDIPNSYLFLATLKDGSQIKQTPEDKSQTTEGKNAFYDVLQNIDKVVSFVLLSDEHVYGVDLTDGHFEIDGVPVFMHNHDKQYKNFRPIYFRKPQIHTNVQIKSATGEILDQADAGYTLAYLLGWQANDDTGKNHERIMEIVI